MTDKYSIKDEVCDASLLKKVLKLMTKKLIALLHQLFYNFSTDARE